MSLLDKLQHLAFDDLARTEAGSAILLVSESEYAELREFAAHTCTVTLAGPQILDLYEACGGEFTELTSWTVGAREAFVTDDGEQMPAGMYATCTEYPEEGFLGPLGVGSEADSAALQCTGCVGVTKPICGHFAEQDDGEGRVSHYCATCGHSNECHEPASTAHSASVAQETKA